MVHCSLLIGIDCYFVVFIYNFCKCRPFAELGCGVLLTAVQMPITRKSQAWDFFRFPKQQMREVEKSKPVITLFLAVVQPPYF